MINYINKKKFYIILPPPNITGELHIGHFYQYFIIDIIIKWKIIQGYKIFYILGFDHAGISTFIKFKNKKTIKKFKNKIFKKFFFQLNYINFYLKKKKIEFTLNKKYKILIKKIFLFFFKKKYIYIGKKILSFDYKIKSIVSDIEIKKFYCIKKMFYIKYKSYKKNIIISTSNIESIISSNVILFNEKDNRYFKIKKILDPFKKKNLILKNKNINKNFGSGLMILSPNLNYKDFLICISKDIKITSYFNEKLKINFNSYKYKNNKFIKLKKEIFNYKLSFYNIKKNIYNYLIKNNYIICIKNYKSTSFFNEKTKCKIISIITDQFFFKIRKILSLKKISEKIKIFPNKYKKIYIVWLKNINDWCISRQIKWGLNIPLLIDENKNIYYKKENRFRYFFLKEVFDTWFNSSIWIFFYFNNFKKKQNLLISGFDILFFWIIKMIIINILSLKKIIIKKIFLHGIIRNNKNEKFSKSMNKILNFNKFKNKIFFIKKNLLKKINKENIKIEIKKKKKKYYFYKESIFIFFYLKKELIKYYKNFNYLKIINLKKKISNSFINKKIFLIIKKILFPFNNEIINKNWNFNLNFYLKKNIFKNFFIFKIFNKNYILNDLKILNYFVIFFKIKIIFYVKYKNITI